MLDARRTQAEALALTGALVLTMAIAAPARAGVPHTVEPGETLWSIAVASNLTTGALAAANGLPEDAYVVAGSTVEVPSEAEAATALGLPGEAPSAAQPVVATAPDVVASPAEPQAATGYATSAEIGQIAAAHGVAPDLAAALAWQESGFNNGLVSSANASGVMQILPGTWSWVQANLAGHTLNPDSPQDNVHAGVLYLARLIDDAGGDESLGVAAYYQGASSVASDGVLAETQRYVDNVMAQRSRFGG